jgi:hypothetical protein
MTTRNMHLKSGLEDRRSDFRTPACISLSLSQQNHHPATLKAKACQRWLQAFCERHKENHRRIVACYMEKDVDMYRGKVNARTRKRPDFYDLIIMHSPTVMMP